MSEAIEPGDLVRVIRSHCPAAWEEEGNRYFIAMKVEAPAFDESLWCSSCKQAFDVPSAWVQGLQGDPTNWNPAAWLRKVPGLTPDEIAEVLSDVLEVV